MPARFDRQERSTHGRYHDSRPINILFRAPTPQGDVRVIVVDDRAGDPKQPERLRGCETVMSIQNNELLLFN